MRQDRLSAARVIKFLALYPADLTRTYIEYIIKEENNKEPRYHTKLIQNYIDAIEKLKPKEKLPFAVRVQAGKEVGVLGKVIKYLSLIVLASQ